MPDLTPLTAALALVAMLAAYDRICGAWANGIKRIVLTAVLGVGLWLVIRLPLPSALLAVGVYAWRSPPWRMFGGDLAATRQQFVGTVERHLLALLCLPALILAGAAWRIAALALVVFAIVAALLSRLNRINADKGRDINTAVELARGAALGAAFALALS